MRSRQMEFPKSVPCLYHGSMYERHGDATVIGGFYTLLFTDYWYITFPDNETYVVFNRDSFTVND